LAILLFIRVIVVVINVVVANYGITSGVGGAVSVLSEFKL
jgi:hypothetical protein